jgi:predicted RNA-binding Zn-ribbon protein involved in translation (DUF1610 family)
MGCSARKSESPELVQIGGAARGVTARRSAIEEISGKKIAKPAPAKARIDFHCPDCGAHRAAYPNYRHKCEPGPIAYQIDRESICERCPSNSDGVCMELKAIQPDRPCLIHVGIEIPTARCPAGRWLRVRWNCDQCGSSVFNEKGLERCPVCHPIKKQTPDTVPIAFSLDPPAEPNHPLAVVSVATGQKAIDLSKITWPRFRQYAEFIGADFIGINDDRCPDYPLANKFRVGAITRKYDRAVFLDTDIWLRSNVGNLFEQFEPGAVWMHPDTNKLLPGHQEWMDSQTARMAAEQLIKSPPASKCYNSGVVIFDGQDSGIWDPPPILIGTNHVSEQWWVEYRSQYFATVRDLPPEFNTQWYWWDFRKLEPTAKVVHLANCPHDERLSRMKTYARRESGDFV